MAQDEDRRRFLKQAAGLAGAVPLAAPSLTGAAAALSAAPAVAGAEQAGPRPVKVYHSLAPDEAAFVEAMVNVMCPADELTPNGVDSGIAIGIDRLFAGAWGQGEGRYLRGPFKQGKPQLGLQLPLTPEQFYKAGIAAARAACQRLHGKEFAELPAATADEFLQQIWAGKLNDEQLPLGSWFDEVVYPLFLRACFADPMYGGNRGKVFWKMIGYPGLPAAHGLDMARYRGKPYPGAKTPKSIEDLS
jgi:gluconate 2-dehydrogenase gamma chain